MSDERPTATTHERMTAVEEVVPVLEERTRKTLTDVRWLLAMSLGSIVAVVAATVSTIAFAQDAGTKAAKVETAGITTEQAALKANVQDLRAEVADLKSEFRELRKDLRIAIPRLPAIVEPEKDAGR